MLHVSRAIKLVILATIVMCLITKICWRFVYTNVDAVDYLSLQQNVFISRFRSNIYYFYKLQVQTAMGKISIELKKWP